MINFYILYIFLYILTQSICHIVIYIYFMIYFQKKCTTGVGENEGGAYAVREKGRKPDERKSSRKYVQNTEASIYARAD